MEKKSFKKILFDTVFCTMACDGDIDQREIEEMKKIDQHTAYFEDIDLSRELDHLVSRINEKGSKVISELFNQISSSDLNTIQELLILEVSLRVIYADERIDENEIKFIKLLRSKLRLHDETIKERFGPIEFLYDQDYSKNVSIEKEQDFIKTVRFPEIQDLKNIDFDIGDSK